MAERPPGEPPGASPPPRTFYSSTAANDFFDRFQTMFREQQTQVLQAQEAFVSKINGPIVALTANIERLLNILQPPRRSPNSTTERETLFSSTSLLCFRKNWKTSLFVLSILRTTH